MRIAVINGPNLNLLGTREPEIYGTATLAEIEARLQEVGKELGATVTFAQHNGEGEIIDAIHAARSGSAGIIINAGAYTHTSLAIRDALTGVALPFVDLHLTNIYAREPERRRSLLADSAVATITGFGSYGYEMALRGLIHLLTSAPARG